MIKLNKEISDWLDKNDTDDYKKVIIMPLNVSEEDRLLLLSYSILGIPRRRELINNLITAFTNLSDLSIVEGIQSAIHLIGEWQNQKK